MSKRQSLSGGPPMFQSIALTMPERYAQRQAESVADAPPANDDSYDFVSGYYDTAGEDDDGGAAPTTQTYFRQLAASKSAAEMSGIEQTLEYFDWTGRGSSRGLEQQIINELQLVDSAMVHSLVLPDDRTADLVAVLDRGIEECWDLERKLMVYKLQLKSLAENFKTVDAKKTTSSTVSSMLDPAPPRTQK
ncbi:hypothetical protein POJ06DRAFT_34634 [Lipomyces tetrasporus]|uniref:Exocyst complex component Sec3 coiled-coil domain-containing protein n=1 Tax=Lipomyces tetrasporus TaxID=54092 RepID=A0AAD7VPA4_9ASCO|nr:uncharacterized protein POJ06DRAFT_34634 [Lipomyces tetrasporus]KAJ8097567.1 hypothetical protein POJ06DRAFT_34634 [Lipomyces tetrasporus]